MPFKAWFCLLTLIALAQPVCAETDQAPELFARIGHYAISYKINVNGSFVEDRNWSMTILKEQAVASAKQASISYSTSIQKAEVLQAYTLKVDGRRIDAPKSNFKIEANSGKDKQAPVFSDRTTLTVVFPEVTVGDTTVFSYRLTATEPMFPKQFSVQETFSRSQAYDDVQVKIDAPVALWTQHEARQMTQVQDVVKDGRRTLEWTFENKQPVKNKRENYSVYDLEQEPGFAFSTFRNYAELAAAYGTSARPKAAVTERTRKLAVEIVEQQTPHATFQLEGLDCRSTWHQQLRVT